MKTNFGGIPDVSVSSITKQNKSKKYINICCDIIQYNKTHNVLTCINEHRNKRIEFYPTKL